MLPSGDQMSHLCRKSGYQMAAMFYTESITVVPATSGHHRFGVKVAPRGRWPPDTGTLTRQRQ